MASIFLSHCNVDKLLARKIAQDLKAYDFGVWLDEWEIVVGDSITQKINKGLDESEFVAVLLTDESVKSGWVEKEWQSKVGEEAESKRTLVLPLKGNECKIPPLLRDKKYADFETDYSVGIKDLIRAIRKHSGISDIENDNKNLPVSDRIIRLGVGGLPLPCFFPSISSAAKNNLTPLQHLKILSALRHPLFLISAYDILNPEREVRISIKNKIAKAAEEGRIVLLDSGVYENRWSKSKEKWPKKNFRQTLRDTNCHLAFCYDNPNPKIEVDKIISNIIRDVTKDKKEGDFKYVLPIAHTQNPQDFPTICVELAKELNPPLIAVPERELGEGVLEAAERVLSIRHALNNTGKYYPLHILGTGNPLSILIYVALGADSFDGLDWCQTAVDHSTGCLYHTFQFDFFVDQTQFGSAKNLPYSMRLFAHNLKFYSNWMDRIRVAIQSQSISKMIDEFLPKHIAERLKQYQSNLSN